MRGLLHEVFDRMNNAKWLGAFAFGLLGGMFSIHGFCPFACSAFAALAILGRGEYAAACGACVGIFVGGSYMAFMPIGICVLMSTIWKLWQKDRLKLSDRLLIVAVSQLSLIFTRNSSIRECLMVPLMCVLSVVATVVVYNGIQALRCCIDRKRLVAESELMSLCLIVGFTLLLLTSTHTEHFSAAIVAAGCIAMLCACISSTSGLCVAVIAAVGAGYNCITGRLSVSTVGIISLACVLCSLVKEHGKMAVAVMCFSTSLLFGYFIADSMSVIDCIASATVFICIPQKFIYATDAFLSFGKEHRDDSVIRKRVRLLTKATMGINDALSMGSLTGDGQLAIRQLGAITGLLDGLSFDKHHKCPICVDVGMACIPKSKCAHTGDSVGTAETGGRTIVAVSDGMGSGILAHNESSAAIDSFIDMTRAGFNTCDSIDCANRRLIARCENEFYATLDALVIDKTSCIATAVKMGAPPSFLIRNGTVHTICGESLPLGIIESVVPAVKKMQVHENDIFLLLTDGVTDALGKNLVATITDYINTDKTPGEIANELLDIACFDGAQDDMSIVCVVVRGKEKERGQNRYFRSG